MSVMSNEYEPRLWRAIPVQSTVSVCLSVKPSEGVGVF